MGNDPGYWAVILGGSSGFGLASARKLARHGMNICIVHRDRRGAMARITPVFDELRGEGVRVATFNLDALSDAGRDQVLTELPEAMAGGRVRLLLHSIAFGNLKLLAPCAPDDRPKETRKKLAETLSVTPEKLDTAIAEGISSGDACLSGLADAPAFDNLRLLDAEDFSRTVHAMGTSLAVWVQDLAKRDLFAADARVLSLTSEGNSVAWLGYAAVSAAKAALESVSRAIAKEFAPYGIRCNVIQAGVSDTPALRMIPGHERIMAQALSRNPFGRLTRPEDVADLVYLLTRDEAAWINGALICADGGERIA